MKLFFIEWNRNYAYFEFSGKKLLTLIMNENLLTLIVNEIIFL